MFQEFFVGDDLSGGEVISLRCKFYMWDLYDFGYLCCHANAINEAEFVVLIVECDGKGVFIGLGYPLDCAPKTTGIIEGTNNIGQSQADIG